MSQVTKMEWKEELRKEFLNKFSQVTWGGEEWLGNKRPNDVFDWFISKLTLSESRVREEYKPKIKVYALDQKTDGKKAKILEKIANHQWRRYETVIETVTHTKTSLEMIYGIKTDWNIWEAIVEEIIQLDLSTPLKEK